MSPLLTGCVPWVGRGRSAGGNEPRGERVLWAAEVTPVQGHRAEQGALAVAFAKVQVHSGSAQISVIRAFCDSTGELIGGIESKHILFGVSARREECGHAVSGEPHFIFCPPSSKTVEITEGQDPAL